MREIWLSFVVLVSLFLSNMSFAHDKVVVIPLNSSNKLDNLITVSKSGGDYTNPAEALASITDASETNQYTVLIGPGDYILTSPLVMKRYVTISGSGHHSTTLKGEISSSDKTSSAIVKGAHFSSISNIHIYNYGTNEFAIGILNNGTNPTISSVRILVVGGAQQAYGIANLGDAGFFTRPRISTSLIYSFGNQYSYGIENDHSNAEIKNSVISAGGGSYSRGIYNHNNSSPKIESTEVEGWDSSINAIGIYNSSSSPIITNSRILARDTNCFGIYSHNGSSSTIKGVNVTARSGLGKSVSRGIYIESSSPTLYNVESYAYGAVENTGLMSSHSTPVISNSKLEGSTQGLYVNGITNETRVLRSSIVGGATIHSGTLTCVNSDNGISVQLNSSCQ